MTDSYEPDANRFSSEREEAGIRYLDEVQDESYRRSSLHGDAHVEAEFRLPVRAAKFRRLEAGSTEQSGHNADRFTSAADGKSSESASDRMSLYLSGRWRMKGCEPTDPGDPAPFTGWFGRRGQESQGMQEKWYTPGYDRSDWDEVTVPSTVQKSLIELGKLPDPHWDTNTIDELEEHGEPKEFPAWFRRTRVERQDWWLAKTFSLPEEWRGRQLTLRFGGMDYSGTVFVNGQSLGHHVGMFGGPDLDITDLVGLGSDSSNELVVRLDQAPQSWNGKLKGSPGFGWHYGHLISLGLWQDVIVTAEADVSVRDPYVTTESIGEEGAKLCIAYTLDSLLAQRTDVSTELVIRRKLTSGGVREPNAANRGVTDRNGDGTHPHPSGPDPTEELRFLAETEIEYGRSCFSASIVLPNPALWWPNGYGEPALYELEILVSTAAQTADGSPSSPDSLHRLQTTFGVRTVEMSPALGAKPEEDYRWQFVINGVPMFVKGANWCWPEPLLEQDERRYERLLELARRGGVQMLRAWGGGLVESDAFYQRCDEKGLMVYQEFPLCWGPPDSPHTDLGVLDRQVSRSIKRLRSHPSLVMWGGGNENGAHGGADEGLFLVGRRCRGLDPSRPFHRTDPWGGSVHNWDVYHGGEPLEQSTLGMPSVFYGEYGIPSQPSRESCLRCMPEEQLDVFPPTEDSRGWKAHFHQFGLKDIIKVMRYGAYGPIRSWDDYMLYSQSAQGNSIAFTGDVQRAGSGRGKTGFWYYKFSELFPGHSWGVVDFYGTPKLSYYRARQTCLPRSAFVAYEKSEGWKAGETFRFSLYAANDTREPLEQARVEVVLYNASLQNMQSWTWASLTLSAGETAELNSAEWVLPHEQSLLAPFLLAVSLHTEQGVLLSDRWYAFNGQPKTEELLAFEQAHRHQANEYPEEEAIQAFDMYGNLPDAPLRNLPETALEWMFEDGETTGGKIRIQNVGEYPAYRVIIEGFPSAWDSYLEDNDLGLRPGEQRQIAYETGLGGDLDHLKIGAWNAKAVTAKAAMASSAQGQGERR
ncbi:hypothetical protein B9G55_17590 [Saccharibacillus sp. O16]|nr:hypothetical protein B9G55_17590 [Saccharibacillus sp. O16]